MNITDFTSETHKLLFSIRLKPIQGSRFQPTGFPGLGAATFQTAQGLNLIVESAQSMANRLELVTWDEVSQRPVEVLDGISYVNVLRNDTFLTSSILEAHRINSPYMLEGKDKSFFEEFKGALQVGEGAINREAFSQALFKYDINSLLHGVFLAKKELSGGRLRLARAISAFIEATGGRVATSGGVKNDHVNPSGSAKEGFGNVPFARDEYTAEEITLHVNIDIAQLRGYGLNDDQASLLLTLALFKLRRFVSGSMRLRTACDLERVDEVVRATKPADFILPSISDLEDDLKRLIERCKDKMKISQVNFNDQFKKSKDKKKTEDDTGAEG